MEEQVRVIFERHKPAVDLDSILHRLRSRSLLLRLQATACMGLIAFISIALIVFLATRSYTYSSDSELQRPQSTGAMEAGQSLFSRMEQRHIDLANQVDGYIETAMRDAVVLEGASTQKERTQAALVKLEQVAQDLRETKRNLQSTFSADRETLSAEVRKIREERETTARDSAERLTLIRLTGDAAFRVGAIVVSVYFMSILSNVAKYWYRVADHLSAVADTFETLSAANMALDKGINALSPHPIDFQADEPLSLKTVKNLLSVGSSAPKT